ncbi:Transmembrane protease serine 11F [Trichinella pseudospiralis]|uniref:Transmembrane protease serine 11F n=1 Tax=Trichinella pseudospiralis TaxID=6337 RepID=A0A0V1E7L7_TRIPS|nr:Transmembrane protease serine 11F [Trichinella pseudospiralis]
MTLRIVFTLALWCIVAFGEEDVHVENFYIPQGYVAVPQYEEKYKPNSKYRFNIYGSTFAVNKYIQLIIRPFQIEGYAEIPCIHDWLAVYAGEQISQLDNVCSFSNRNITNSKIFCNHHLPSIDQLLFKSTDLVVEFCSDNVIEDSGFELKWSTSSDKPPVPTPKPKPSPPPVVCGDELELADEPLSILSPDFQLGHYPPNAYCKWKVRVNVAAVLVVKSALFELEAPQQNHCLFDRVIIRMDSDDGETETFGSFCGKNGPNFYIEPQNGLQLTIEFISDDKISWIGFEIQLSLQYPKPTLCGIEYTISQVQDVFHFYSPNYPAVTKREVFCKVTINRAPEMGYFNVTFRSFNIEEGLETMRIGPNQTHERLLWGTMNSAMSMIFHEQTLTLQYAKLKGKTSGQGFHIEIRASPKPAFCRANEILCADEMQCISMRKFCDGENDCDDGSDESNDWCTSHQNFLNKKCGISFAAQNIDLSGPKVAQRLLEARAHSWPWNLFIAEKGHFTDPFCAGTLISPDWMITTSNCFEGKNQNFQSFMVRVGVHNIGKSNCHHEQLRQVQQAYYFENNFDNGKKIATISTIKDTNFILPNSIVLLRLNESVVQTNWTGFACLPPLNYFLKENVSCLSVGFGIYSDSKRRNALMQKITRTIAQSSSTEKDKNVLLTDELQQDRCYVDKGGPLFIQNYKGQWTLQGLLWKSSCPAAEPDVYVRVSFFFGFIYGVFIRYS